jgi:hypothetical protein
VCTVLVEVTDPAVVRDEGSATDRRVDKRDRFGLQKRVKLEGGGRYKKIEGKRKHWRSWSDLTEGRVVCVRRARSQHATERAAVAAPAEPEIQAEIQPENPENVSPTPPTLDTPGTPAHTPGRYLGYIRVLYCTVPALHSPSVTFSHL